MVWLDQLSALFISIYCSGSPLEVKKSRIICSGPVEVIPVLNKTLLWQSILNNFGNIFNLITYFEDIDIYDHIQNLIFNSTVVKVITAITVKSLREKCTTKIKSKPNCLNQRMKPYINILE